jgi:hypothetical protein
MNAAISRKRLLGIAGSLGVFAAIGAPADAGVTAASVLGAWRLETFDVVEAGKSPRPRFGNNPVGYLMYTPSGKMSATLSGIHRPPFVSTAVTPDVESKGQMLSDFLSYAGTYEIKGDRVFHHVEVSVFTNIVGTTLERQFKLEGDTLTIRTITPGMWGDNSILVWKRA